VGGDADVTLEASWRDFIEVSKGAMAPPLALLQRRLKLRGGPRNLLTFAKLFG
jgi:putative sterol carrier protein